MKLRRRFQLGTAACLMLVATRSIHGQYELSWRTIDGGGGYSSGGSYELEGTIGQYDAGFQSGGVFELDGGFWSVSTSAACICPGDVNGDSLRNGADIQQFVTCMAAITPDGACNCADVHAAPGLDGNDIAVFVADLLAAAPCN